jgi:hypothetical protein
MTTRLAAAAPKLLAALEEAVKSLDYACEALQAPAKSAMRETLAEARSAIALTRPIGYRGPRVDTKAIAEDAAKGILPEIHPGFYEYPTHKAYWNRMRVIESAAKTGDITLLREFAADPFWDKVTSSRTIVRRYIQNAITALEVQKGEPPTDVRGTSKWHRAAIKAVNASKGPRS